MHLHFVQSLEPLQGAGLGQAALSLHLAMRGKESSQASGGSSQFQPPNSVLLSTRAADIDRTWPDVIQGLRTFGFHAVDIEDRTKSAGIFAKDRFAAVINFMDLRWRWEVLNCSYV